MRVIRFTLASAVLAGAVGVTTVPSTPASAGVATPASGGTSSAVVPTSESTTAATETAKPTRAPTRQPTAAPRRVTAAAVATLADEDCVELAVADWGSPMTDQTAPASGTACFAVTPATSGAHLLTAVDSSGAWASYQLLDPTGTVLLNHANWGSASRVVLGAGTTYRLVASLPAGTVFSAAVLDLGDDAGCPAVTPTWAGPATQLAFPAGTAVSCRSVSANVGDRLRISTGGVPAVDHAVFDASGAQVCAFQGGQDACALTGTGPWRVVSQPNPWHHVTTGTTTTAAPLWLADYAQPQTCPEVSLGTWDAAPPIDTARTEAPFDCHRITTAAGGAHVFLSAPRAYSPNALGVELFTTTATTPPEVAVPASGDMPARSLEAATQYLVVTTGAEAGLPYVAGLYPVRRTSGCVPAPVRSWDAASPSATLSFPTRLEVACHVLDGVTGQRLRLHSTLGTSSNNTAVWNVVYDAGGDAVCAYANYETSSDCTLTGTGPWHVISRTHWRGGELGMPSDELWIHDYGDTAGCTSAALTTWNATLPITGTLPAGGLACRLITSTSGGLHVGRVDNTGGYATKPRLQLYTSAGTRVAEVTYSDVPVFTLQAGQPYLALITSAGPGAPMGEYAAGVLPFDDEESCPATDVSAWDEPDELLFPAGVELACRRVEDVEPGDRLRVLDLLAKEVIDPVRVRLLDPAGGVACALDAYSLDRTCTLTAAGTYRVLAFVQTLDGAPPSRVELAVTDPATTVGCDDALDATVSMRAPRVTLTRTASVEDCHLLHLESGDRYRWEGVSHTTGEFINVEVLDGAGSTVCHHQVVWQPYVNTCRLTGAGPYRVLAGNAAPSRPAHGLVYEVAARRTNDPVGCSALPAPATGFPDQSGTLEQNPGLRCFTVAGGNKDRFRMRAYDPRQPALSYEIEVLRPDGTSLARSTTSSPYWEAALDTDGVHTILVSRADRAPGPFVLTGTCTNTPCGPGGVRIDAVTREVGQAREVTIEIEGKGLVAGTTFDITGPDGVAHRGSVASVAPDGLAASARFNTSAALGQHSITATNPGGVTAHLAAAFRVAAPTVAFVRPAIWLPANLAAGRDRTMRVRLENTGNVDAIAVPVFLTVPVGLGFTVTTPMVQPNADGTVTPTTFQSWMVRTVDGVRQVPLIVPRISAGSSLDVSFQVTGTDTGVGTVGVATGCGLIERDDGGFTWSKCGAALWDAAFEFVPFSDCVATAQNVWANTYGVLSGSVGLSSAVSPLQVLWDGGGCILDILAPGAGTYLKVIEGLMDGVDHIKNFSQVARDCFGWGYLRYGVVSSRDPNAVVGPLGGSQQHTVRGDQTHHYDVYFENAADATAPAQEVRITSDLDPAVYDLATVRFTGVAFGRFSWEPRRPASSLDELVDLAREDGLRLAVDAGVTPAGHLEVFLQSIDPLTDQLPEDAQLGFLPPDKDGVEGQGVVGYDVDLLAPESGDIVTNVADIVFDVNAPIRTNVWSNLVDRDNPTATASAPATTSATQIPVALGGSDPTSRIAAYDAFVSVDGGPPVTWLRAASSVPAYAAVAGHTYTFRAVAIDDAGNRSALSAPTTTVVTGSTPSGGGGAPPPSTGGPGSHQALVLAVTVRPAIVGTPRVGKQLRVTPGTWTVPATVRYQWLVGRKPIQRATKQRLKLTPSLRGKRISVRVTATAPGQQPVVIVVTGKSRVR